MLHVFTCPFRGGSSKWAEGVDRAPKVIRSLPNQNNTLLCTELACGSRAPTSTDAEEEVPAVVHKQIASQTSTTGAKPNDVVSTGLGDSGFMNLQKLQHIGVSSLAEILFEDLCPHSGIRA